VRKLRNATTFIIFGLVQKKSLYGFCVGSGLLLLISVPTFVPALHELLHYHTHLQCTATANDVHLHSLVIECELCKYLASVKYYQDPAATSDVSDAAYDLGPVAFTESYIPGKTGTPHLRGPPQA
jgi:hypothetical protein